MAIQGRLAKVNITGDKVAFTGEGTTTTDDKTYKISDSTKEIWAIKADIVVKVDGVETTENYEINRLKGEVVFETVDGTRGAVTVDGEYLPRIEVTEAHEYTLTMNGETLDKTTFGKQWNERMQGLKSAEASLSEFYNTNQYLLKDLINGKVVVIEFIPDRNTPTNYYRLFALVTSDELTAPVADLVDMSISFESTDRMVASY